jgi:phosphoribosylanthranilate isomerase
MIYFSFMIIYEYIRMYLNLMYMKKILFAFALSVCSLSVSFAQQYEFKVITSVESIVPMGIGRSMMVEAKEDVDVNKISIDREDGKSKQGSLKRKDVKIDEITETKLLNFYSAVGINFQNIASNDAAIAAKLSEVAKDGWELAFVTSGVESDAGEKDGKGIFITRYIFKRLVK